MFRLKSLASISASGTRRAYPYISACRVKISTMRWMSWARRRFLAPSLTKPLEASTHEDALARVGVLFVQHDDAGGDARAVEQVGGQANNPLD